MRSIVVVISFILVLVFIGGCSVAAAPGRAKNSSESDSSAAALGEGASTHSPALGTAWGERIESRLSYVTFDREDAHQPDATASIYYDDSRGIRELSGLTRERARAFTTLGGDIEFGLTDEERIFWSPFLPGIERSGKYYVRGGKGDRYGIFIRNRSDNRIEVVLSVDGLDVINGREASFSNRGYIVDPGEKLLIEGFRDSRQSVAAFRFADVSDSYAAEKTGEVRNVGVVGLAVFAEKGSRLFATRGRSKSRANPFPGEFATAP